MTRYDVGIPAVVLAVAWVEAVLARPEGLVAGMGLELVACAALVWRRRRPIAAAITASSIVLAIPLFGPELDELAAPILVVFLSIFSLARYRSHLAVVAALGFVFLFLLVDYTLDQADSDITDVFFVLALTVPPYVVGRLARRLADQAEQLREHAELVKREAVRDERDRIARELHDVIAHSVSAMVVQTAAAQDVLRSHPDRAAQILADVAATGRRALSETGQLLHVLRDEADELGLRPVPGLADVPDLVARFRGEGLDVDLCVSDVPELPTSVDVSAYRIIQECLTNALRYGVDHRAMLAVAGTRGAVTIRASNRAMPAGGKAGGRGSGLGLLGVAERVGHLGGALDYGVRTDGVFELVASLPVASR